MCGVKLLKHDITCYKLVGHGTDRSYSGAPTRAKCAWDRAPYSKNMVNLFSFGCHVIDRAYAFTDCTGGVSQECLRKYTSFIFDIHHMVNGQLSKQDSH